MFTWLKVTLCIWREVWELWGFDFQNMSQGHGRNFDSHPLGKPGPTIICMSTRGKNTTMSDIWMCTTYILSS